MKKIILLLTIIFMQNCWAPKEGKFFSALRERESKGKIDSEVLWGQEYPEAASELDKLRKQLADKPNSISPVILAINRFPKHAPRFMNVFYQAERSRNLGMLKSFLESAFIVLVIWDSCYETYHQVYHPILEDFAKRYKLNVNFISDKFSSPDEKQSPLHLAGAFNNLSLARLLLKMGADKRIKNSEGLTPEEYVIEEYHDREEYRNIRSLLKTDE